MANLVTLQGQGQPLIRNVMTLKSCSPIVGVDVMSFDTEKEVLLAWRVIFLPAICILIGYSFHPFSSFLCGGGNGGLWDRQADCLYAASDSFNLISSDGSYPYKRFILV